MRQMEAGDASLWRRLLHRERIAMYASARASPTVATPVPVEPCPSPADSLGTWVRGTLAWAVLKLHSSLEVPGNGSDAALLLRVSVLRHFGWRQGWARPNVVACL